MVVALASMSEVRRHSTQLRKLSSHFSLNIDVFDTSKSLFDTWSELERRETNLEQDAQKELNSEQLQVAIDENPTCTTRALSKTFNVSRHMTKYGNEKTWQSLKCWEMSPPSHTISQKSTSNRV
ncbi:hypothetical protein ACTXT7_010127 [Hymenolepis weldensis]